MCREGCRQSGAYMGRTVLSSMWWRFCRGLLHLCELACTETRRGLSTRCELTLKPIAVGVRHRRAPAVARFVPIDRQNRRLAGRRLVEFGIGDGYAIAVHGNWYIRCDGDIEGGRHGK